MAKDTPTCVLCNQIYEPDLLACDHCHQRFSLDSSRSTRGGSEVPGPQISLLSEDETIPMSDTRAVVNAVGHRFKAVFGKGRENKEFENEGDCISHLHVSPIPGIL